MYEVKDGSRTLQFNGKLLGESSSWRRDSTRWIEFKLFKTDNGSYILSRVGVSVTFHGAACPLVKRYALTEAGPEELKENAIPCEECYPSANLPVVFPEKDRTWAQVSEDPEPVLDALYKYDSGGARYLTNVAQRLLEQASKVDEKIESIYRIEMIP
jgi:DNA-binding PadR family transcriptional regulator